MTHVTFYSLHIREIVQHLSSRYYGHKTFTYPVQKQTKTQNHKVIYGFGKFAFLLSCWELDEKIDTALISVQLIWSYSQQQVSLA